MKDHKQYLLGEYRDGQFWCWAEFTDKTKALMYWDDALRRHENKRIHIQLIQKTVSFEVVTESQGK
jgi:hypothetical protein